MAPAPFTTSRFLRTFTGWWLIWGVLQAALLYWLGLSWRTAGIDSFVCNAFSAAASLLLFYLMQFYLPQKERYWYILFISIVLSSIIAFSSRKILSLVFSEDQPYLILMHNSFPVRWGIAFLLIVCMAMICMMWYSFREQREAEQRRADAEKLSRDAELFSLQRRLQPHFLFNSLNSISALAGTRAEEARKMIQQLSDFLRGTIKKEDDETVTLEEELQHLQLYLDIETVRFGHRLQVNIHADEKARLMKLPALILQPITENAVKFGLYDTTENVTISITAETENNQLIITVKNPYDPETARPHKGEGFGLSSVQRRLYLVFARNGLLTTTAENNIFTAIIKIPQLR